MCVYEYCRKRLSHADTHIHAHTRGECAIQNTKSPGHKRNTYTFLKCIPLRLWIIEYDALQIDGHLTEKIVAAKHIGMPHR